MSHKSAVDIHSEEDVGTLRGSLMLFRLTKTDDVFGQCTKEMGQNSKNDKRRRRKGEHDVVVSQGGSRQLFMTSWNKIS